MVREIPNRNLFQRISSSFKEIGGRTLIAYLSMFLLLACAVAAYALTQERQSLVQNASFDDSNKTFIETFDGQPTTPQPFTSADWDIVANVSDSWGNGSEWATFNTTHAHHGADCSPPLATHTITDIYNTVFNCKDHMMTSIEGRGYSALYLTPNHKVDFQNGEAVIKWDVSSFKTTGRQWWDIWIQPFENNFQLPLEDWLPAYSGEPKNAISIKMEGETFQGFIDNNFNAQALPKTADGWKSLEQVLKENNLPISPTRRDTFELRISKTHIKFGMPAFNHWWIDTDISALGWGDGIVSWGTHEYNSSKDCTPNPPTECAATTWHWDNLSISPAIPFTIIRGNERGVNATTSNKVNFPKPAPANAHLRFAATGTIQVSFDNGATYQNARKNEQEKVKPEHFSNYWTPIPQGTTTALFKGGPDEYISQWMVRDPAIFAESASSQTPQQAVTSTPTPSPTAVQTGPAPTSTPIPTPTKTPTPTFVQPPTPTPTDAPAIPNSITIDFEDIANTNRSLTGVYPANIIDWGTSGWYASSPWKMLFTKNVSLSGSGTKTGTFTFIQPRTFYRFDAYADTATTLTVACSGQVTRQFTLAAGDLKTLSTGWTTPCTNLTLTSTNGWDTNFDNIVVGTANTQTPPTPTPTVVPTTNPMVGQGLTGNYFNNINFTSFALTRADKQINFNLGEKRPHSSIDADTYSVIWKGQILAPVTGAYTFYTKSDDGVALWVDDKQIVNNMTDHAATENKGTLALVGGRKYNIRLDYYENRGNSVIELRWSAPGVAKQIIPQKYLFLQ